MAVVWLLLVCPAVGVGEESDSPAEGSDATSNPALVGVDVSHYQGNIKWHKVREEVQFAFIKATEGTTYTDPTFADNYEALKNLKVPFGAYHFFEPDESGATQAEHFLSKVDIKGLLPPVLDIEISQGTSADKLKQEARQWLEKVESRTGCRPTIYTYKDFWETYLGEEFNEYPLWLADYAKQPTLPDGVAQWTFWQYSHSGLVEGIDSRVDMDRFSGTLTQLRSMLCR